MSNNKRFFTLIVGAAALVGLTYGVTRRGLQRRTSAVETQTRTSAAETGARSPAVEARTRLDDAVLEMAAPWDALDRESPRSSRVDALDLALNLGGVFDGDVGSDELTVRPTEHVPLASSADDEDPPSPDDLGRAWLSQATQSERSLRETDLTPEIDNIAETVEDLGDNGDMADVDEEREDEEHHA